jgi:hypothetical protein
MENFGIPLGLTLFVFIANLPVYLTLSIDSYIVKIPSKATIFVEVFVDFAFAWFIAGLHFNGGASWFWQVPSLMRQMLGAFLYLFVAFLFIRHHKTNY